MHLPLCLRVTFGVTIGPFLIFNDDDWLVARMNLGINVKAKWHFTATILLVVQVEFHLGLSKLPLAHEKNVHIIRWAVSGTKRSLSLGMHGLSNAHNSPERLYKHQ